MDFLVHEREYRTKKVLDNRKNCSILVLGLGALGSNLVPLLVKNGFINIVGLDMDRVEAHNIGNQFYNLMDVGKKKAQVMKARIHREMGVSIDCIDQDVFKVSSNIFKKFDLIVDTFDNWEARGYVKDICSKLGISDRLLHAGLSDQGYSEVKWDNIYKIPKVDNEQIDICEYPLAVNLVYFTNNIICEVVCGFVDKKYKKNISFTLNDIRVSII